jgi:hypothetical protein
VDFVTFLQSLANLATVLLVIVTARQLIAANRAVHATTFKTIFDLLQSPAARRARKRIIELKSLDLKEVQDSSDLENAIETVCHTFDSVGVMLQSNMIPKNIVIQHWATSIYKTWRVVKPYVEMQRKREDEEHKFKRKNLRWRNYEYMAELACQYLYSTPETPRFDFENNLHGAQVNQWDNDLALHGCLSENETKY